MKNKFGIFMVCLLMTASIPISIYAQEKENKEGAERSHSSPSSPSSIRLPLKCATLSVDERASCVVRSAIPFPQKAAMNLKGVYDRGLSGAGQVLGIIEFTNMRKGVPGLEDAIISSLDLSSHGEGDHPDQVAQVAVSKAMLGDSGEYIGIAPGAKVVSVSAYAAKHLENAMEYLLVQGATWINLSFSNACRIPGFKGIMNLELVTAIKYAIDSGAMITIASGNEGELLDEDRYLKSIVRSFSAVSSNIILCNGYICEQPFFDEDDIRFSESSGRGGKSMSQARSFMLTAPYTFAVLEGRGREWNLKELNGTSFSAPAIAAVGLLLTEHAAKSGVKVLPIEIGDCLRATANSTVQEGEQWSWYGAGKVNASAALDLLDIVIQAKKSFNQERYLTSKLLWIKALRKLGPFARKSHIMEAIESVRLSNKVSPSQYMMEGYLREILPFPSCYLKERVEAYRLYFNEAYEESRTIFQTIDDEHVRIIYDKDPLLDLLPMPLDMDEETRAILEELDS